jgi:hypothetical protein
MKSSYMNYIAKRENLQERSSKYSYANIPKLFPLVVAVSMESRSLSGIPGIQ